MWVSALLSLLLAAASPSTADSAQTARMPVTLDLVGDDGLTQKLSTAIQKGLEHDPALRLATAVDHDAVSVTSDSNVNWDKLGGRTVVIYTVHVFRGKSPGEPSVGICYESGMAKCATAIIRLARIEAEGR